MPIVRGEVYFVELGPTRGKELDNKRRPAVVLSVDSINSKPLVVTVIPGKTYRSNKPIFPNEVRVEPSEDNGLTATTLFECIQIKALDHSRFDRNRVGGLSHEDMLKIADTLKLCLGIP